MIYHKKGTTHTDKCFSVFSKTQSVNYMDHLKFLKILFESIPDCRTVVLIMLFYLKKMLISYTMVDFKKNI